MCIDTERFERARGRVIGIERKTAWNRHTLGEDGTCSAARIIMHRMTDMHEIPIENFVADIFDGEASD